MATTKVIAGVLDLNEAASESGLKMPSGTNANRPTAVAGQIRNNTNETSEGSASCMEYYKSGAWQKINNAAPTLGDFSYKAVTYTGNSSTQSITGVGFKPDLVWCKRRSTTEAHAIYDSTRGGNKQLEANSAGAQATNTAPYEGVTSFDADGFTSGDNGGTNRSPETYVAWCFKANGGTTSSNTQGTITSTVQASNGFSIVKWTGDGNASSTVGHGLNSTPELIILKDLSNTRDWQVYSSGAGATYKFGGNLNLGSAWNTSAGTNGAFDDPSSTVINFSNGSSSIDNLNASGAEIIAYCFHSVTGKIATGAYTGDGNATGPTISTGFQPNFLLVRRVETGDSWRILDSVRSTSNPRNDYLDPNSTAAEASSVFSNVDFNSTDFQLKTLGSTYNNAGGLYMYLALN